MSSGSARQYAQEEMDIAHALYSIGGEPKPNFSALARNFAVPYHRLRRRFSGQPSRSTRTPAGKRLTEVQESELFDQISRSGYKNIEHFANQILERDHVGDQSPQTVNYKWCQRFARRHRLKFNASASNSSLTPLVSSTFFSSTTQIHHKSGQKTVISPTLTQATTSLAELSVFDETCMLLQRLGATSTTINPNTRASLVSLGCARTASFVQEDFLDPHSPCPPRTLLVAEKLFRNITVYFEISCRNMIFDEHETLITPNGDLLDNSLCENFDSYCFTSTMLLKNGLQAQFRRTLSKASALVEQILRFEHPRTLACFLEVFIHLIQTGLPMVASYLHHYVSRMAEMVTREVHPWGQIYRLLGQLDSESIGQTMAQLWKCITDVVDSRLGTTSRFAVSVRLDYVKRVVTNHLEEEQLLRNLLAQLGGTPRLPTPRVMLNLAHNLSKQGLYNKAEEMALEILSLLQGHEMYAYRIVERIECLKIVSLCYYNQGKILSAEQTMRNAIESIRGQWGIQHSWVPEFMYVLEGWLRDWGREEDASELRAEIEALIGKDETDMRHDSV